VLLVKAGVENEPVVPVPPPPDEVHEVLSVDDQLTVAVAPFAIEDGVAIRVTVGLDTAPPVLVVSVVVDPFVVSVVVDPPPHEARPETANRTAKNNLGITLEPTALLCDMLLSLQLKLGWEIQFELPC
jgi:hypothetical protein